MAKVVSNLPFEEYLNTPALGSGAFAALNRSAKCFEWFHIKENKKQESDEFNFGRIVHAAILEPNDFNKRVLIQPKFDKRTKQGKLDFEKWSSDLPPDALVLSEDKATDLIGMIESIKANPRASDLLKRGEAEVSAFGELNDVPIKGRFDFVVTDQNASGNLQGVFIVDLKTTQDASPRAFYSSMLRYRYWIQAGLYSHLAEKAFNVPVIFVFLAIEKKPPYEVGLYVADSSVIDCGFEAVLRGTKLYKQCLATSKWPGLGEDFQNLSMPEGMMSEYQPNEEEEENVGAN